MWTIKYKDGYIHGYHDREVCRVSFVDGTVKHYRSLHAAKLAITRRRVPPCAASMGCLCAAHARGADSTAPCDARE